MRAIRLLLLGVLALPAACAGQGLQSGPRVLRVSLYPYIPDAASLYWQLEADFEATNPDIELVISLNADYYNDKPAGKGILYEDADVYELDSVFLEDFIRLGKIKEIAADFAKCQKLVKLAETAAQRDSKWYGVPHWVCGNFLLFKKGDHELAAVRTLGDLERVIRKGLKPEDNLLPEQALLIDLCGKSTLGEMYLDAEMDHHKTLAALLPHLTVGTMDNQALEAMKRALSLTAMGYGRDEDYHDRAGFYARQMFRGRGRALVGYSEQLHYGITETLQSSRHDEAKLKDSELQVAEWPLSDEGSQPIGWVDMFVINAKCSVQRVEDAQRFIRFMVARETYRKALTPGWGSAPRYLLPADATLYSDEEIVKTAPLYPQFLPIISRATPVSLENLNTQLRAIGGKLNEALPKKGP
jgi:thiamine pyridinylase